MSSQTNSDTFKKMLQMNGEIEVPKHITTNGAAGFGFRGAMFPGILNGPFGLTNFPLPLSEQKINIYDAQPVFRSQHGQYPKYNEETFKWRSRYSQVPKYGTDIGPNGLLSLNIKR